MALFLTGLAALGLLSYSSMILFMRRQLAVLAAAPKPEACAEQDIHDTVLLIAHRNDLAKLLPLLQSLESQANPILTWVVDDYSEESQYQALEDFCQSRPWLKLLRNAAAPGKKGALGYALARCDAAFVVQTDADCRLGPETISGLSAPLQAGAMAVMGFVQMQAAPNFWSRFAAWEFFSLQLSAWAFARGGRAIMANGAALAYRREAWLAHAQHGARYRSGDDTFFIQALAAKGESIAINPAAVVSTAAPLSLKAFLAQRRRWGAKSVGYRSLAAWWAIFSVALASISPFLLLLSAFWGGQALLWLSLAVASLLVKATFDYRFLKRGARLFRYPMVSNRFFALSAAVYPLYLLMTLAGMLLPAAKGPHWRA